MKKKNLLCLALTFVFLFSSVQVTLAAWKVSDSSTHAISIASLKCEIVEQYEEQKSVKGGQVIDKVVNVKNTGQADSVIRVKIEKVWGKSRTPEGDLIPDTTYSTDNILINYNADYWYYNEQDGYYYYKGILSSGQTTVEPLFKNFKIADDIGNEFDNLTADIVVKMECIQAAANAISAWDMSFEELDITYTPSPTVDKTTEVSFIGKSDGFVFQPKDTDLFSNFKDLLPGETRTQKISVTNNTRAKTEIYLRAEVADQTKATPETLELINRLLKEYVTIVVTEDDGTVVYSGAVWGNPLFEGTNPVTMKYDFSLGKFAAGQNKKLTVQLKVSPEVDNEYQALWGIIRWVWSAEGTETPMDPPKTGDTSNLFIYLGIMFVSGFLLVILLRRMQDRKRQE